MREAIVEQEVRRYFTNQFPQFSISQQCEIQFGTKFGIADIVLHQPIGNEEGRFVAIAECKRWPLPILHEKARAQLKSYMSATNTRYGVLTIGTDPGNWVFCENKYNNYFIEISREDFEKGIESWEPISPDALAINSQGNQSTTRQWKQIALTLGILLVTTYSSLFFLWPDIPESRQDIPKPRPSLPDLSQDIPDRIVYITRTGAKYHLSSCRHLKYSKIPISLEKAKQNYEPCLICRP